MKLTNTIEQHLKSPEIAPSDYVRTKHLELADSIADCHKIYLDTRYWVLFRDVLMGRNDDPHLVELLELIREEVAGGQIICPLSEVAFSEVFIQRDPNTLSKTVALIDELSHGVCLTEIMNRHHMETYHFLVRKTFGDESVIPTQRLVWTKCSYALGYVTPKFDDMPVETAIAIEKAFFDQLWITTLADMHSFLGSCPDWKRESDVTAVIAEMNKGKLDHEDEFNSFKQLFILELRGLVECLLPTFRDVLKQMNQKYTGEAPPDPKPGDPPYEDVLANLVVENFKSNKFTDEFPTLRVHSLLHAGLRWDKKRKYKFNDLPDLRHAAMAIPYCDTFLTEGPLRNLVNEQHLKLNELFPCRTFSDHGEALRHLKEIGK